MQHFPPPLLVRRSTEGAVSRDGPAAASRLSSRARLLDRGNRGTKNPAGLTTVFMHQGKKRPEISLRLAG